MARMDGDLLTMRDTINDTPPVDLEAPGMMELLMQQLLADDGNPTCTQILPRLDLGRGAHCLSGLLLPSLLPACAAPLPLCCTTVS